MGEMNVYSSFIGIIFMSKVFFLITYNLYAQLLMLLFQDKAITYVLYFVPIIVCEMIKISSISL